MIQNLARDYRIQRWGRWRPSAAAERLGVVAVQLETMLFRDGFSFDEAAEALRSNHGVRLSPAQLADLASQLPARVRRRVEGSDGVEAAQTDLTADQRLRDSERQETVRRVQEELRKSLAELTVEDRLLLKMHYYSGLKISTVASALNLDQRQLYTRRDRCVRNLRSSLGKRGIDAEAFRRVLGWWGTDFEVDFGVDDAELGPLRPSNTTEGDGEETDDG